MKKYFFLVVSLVFVSCTDQLMEDASVENPQKPAVVNTMTPEVISHIDMSLESGITGILKDEMKDYKQWSKAIVYVVETKTGKIKAQVAYKMLERNSFYKRSLCRIFC